MTWTRVVTATLALALALALAARPGGAQNALDPDAMELANTQPVAVISLVWGQVTIKHQTGDYKPARWLEPVYPQDFLKTTGPGSKLLITYFFDNHQEVMGPDIEAQADYKGLIPSSGAKIRRDPPRNPFGTGMENPFVYTMKLQQEDFEGADDPDAMDRENSFLAARVSSTFPVVFNWPALPGVKQYKLQIFDTTNQFVGGTQVAGTRYKSTPDLLSDANKGSTYYWQVTAQDSTLVVRKYPFMVLTKPLQAWLKGFHDNFYGKQKSGKLERSDYTDYLLACAQLMQVDEAVNLCQQMADLDSKNPRVFRALTRAYLTRGCPAHARQALDTEIQLGGIDPILP